MSDPHALKYVELEKRLADAQAAHGADSLEVALALELYAEYLRLNKTRLLDAANMEARARVIRMEKRCSKCGGPIDRGTMTAGGTAITWSETASGPIEQRTRKDVVANRCRRCGHIELYSEL